MMRRLIVRGPGLRGPAGRDGLPGVNAVAADTAVATYMVTEGSETNAALQDAVTSEVGEAVPPLVGPLVVAAVAEDATFAAAAADAVTTDIAGRSIAEVENGGDGDTVAFAFIDDDRHAPFSVLLNGNYDPVPQTTQDMVTLRGDLEGTGYRWALAHDDDEIAIAGRNNGLLDIPGVLADTTAEQWRSGRVSLLRRWRAAHGGRRAAPARIFVPGDSVIEGYNATKFETRPTALINQNLRDGATGGIGYVSAQTGGSAGPLADNGWVEYPFAWSANAAPSPHGLAGRGKVVTTSTTGTLTLPLGSTGIDLLHTKGGTGLDGSFSYAIDGGAATTVACSAGATSHANVVQIRNLNPATVHTIALVGISGTCVVEGAFVFAGDETSGVHVFEAGHRSYTTTDWLDTAKVNYLDALAYVAPHLVLIPLGINNFRNGIAVEATKTQLRRMVADIRAATTTSPSFVLVVPWQCSATSPIAPWRDYALGIYDVGEEVGAVVHDWWYDLTDHSTTPPSTTWSPDQCHPNQLAVNLISATLTRTLQGATV